MPSLLAALVNLAFRAARSHFFFTSISPGCRPSLPVSSGVPTICLSSVSRILSLSSFSYLGFPGVGSFTPPPPCQYARRFIFRSANSSARSHFFFTSISPGCSPSLPVSNGSPTICLSSVSRILSLSSFSYFGFPGVGSFTPPPPCQYARRRIARAFSLLEFMWFSSITLLVFFISFSKLSILERRRPNSLFAPCLPPSLLLAKRFPGLKPTSVALPVQAGDRYSVAEPPLVGLTAIGSASSVCSTSLPCCAIFFISAIRAFKISRISGSSSLSRRFKRATNLPSSTISILGPAVFSIFISPFIFVCISFRLSASACNSVGLTHLLFFISSILACF